MTQEQVLVSGIKPTGRPHIGNYFGAIEQFIKNQDRFQSYIFVADLHALTSNPQSDALKGNTFDIVLDYLACGIDPTKTVLFKQSDIPEVTELAWIFSCLTTVPYLMRAHAYKDAESKGKDINAGTFNYPLLMAADILIYGAEVVPVGQDQQQHLEITRDTAEKFNRIYGDVFPLPEAMIQQGKNIVLGTDGKKMSKSYHNTIGIFDDEQTITKAVLSIPTDSKSIEEPKNTKGDTLFSLHELFTHGEEFSDLEERYLQGGIGYKESKDILIKNLCAWNTPLREKRKYFENNNDEVKKILEEGKQKARARALPIMEEVRRITGIS